MLSLVFVRRGGALRGATPRFARRSAPSTVPRLRVAVAVEHRSLFLGSSTDDRVRSPRRRGVGAATSSFRALFSSDPSNDDHVDVGVRYRADVRNVAIVAHVDHGKTTLVDQLLRATGDRDSSSSSDDDGRLVMDDGELERERGITITSKVTRLSYREEGGVVNVVDTPGHADFCGEVDRVLGCVSGVCLVVDAGEGCMAQTKYALSRALSLGLRPVCVLNKLDRPGALARVESGEAESELLDLFDDLGADDEQMDYPTVYASARAGWATTDLEEATRLAKSGSKGDHHGVRALLRAVWDHVPPPEVDPDASFAMAAVNVGHDPYLGRTCQGRVRSGSVRVDDVVVALPRAGGGPSAPSSVAGLFVNRGASRVPLDADEARAGDVVTVAGVPSDLSVGDTLTSAVDPVAAPLKTPPLAPPTLSVDVGANTSPLAGREGTRVTSSDVRRRLLKETEGNATLRVGEGDDDGDDDGESESVRVYGRGELQIGVLVEQMRREGYELTVSPPRVVETICPDTGRTLEPFEEVVVDVDDDRAGAVVNALTGRRRGGVLVERRDPSSDGRARLRLEMPARGLLGVGAEIAALSRGTAALHHRHLEDRPRANLSSADARGRLVCSASGKTTAHALGALSDRGTLFVSPGDEVYPGMIVGESARPGDLDVNAVRAKKTDNMRTQSKEEVVRLPPPSSRTVDALIGSLADDEVLEVTPKSVRLRMRELDAGARRRAARAKKKSR